MDTPCWDADSRRQICTRGGTRKARTKSVRDTKVLYAISALRRAFDFGFQDHPEHHNPARGLKSMRMGKKDRPTIDPFSIQDAETLIAAIHRDWGEAQGNYDEFRFFTGLRPSEQIALVVTDYDATHGIISINKAHVAGVDRDRTKTAEDRRVALCPRAIAVLERQLQLREQLVRAGRLRHAHLFFYGNGEAIRDLRTVYPRWRRTLRCLGLRYRKPYTAHHSSVSWDLMLGRNPLFVAKQHGHSVLITLSVYAAWTRDTQEAEVVSIQRAMQASDYASRREETAATAADATEMQQAAESIAAMAIESLRYSIVQDIRGDPIGPSIGPSPPATAGKPQSLQAVILAERTGLEKSNKISKLLYRKDPDSPFDPYDPQILHQISHYLRVTGTRL
jgi:integrase